MQVAELYLKAGQKAKTGAAYKQAFDYLETGIILLNDTVWQQQYQLALNLYAETAETAYLNGEFERTETLIDVVLQSAESVLDKVRLYEIRIQSRVAQNQMLPAIEVGLQVLEILGVSLSESPPQNLVIEDLYALGEMTDPNQLAAMRILMTILAASYVGDPNLFPRIVFTMVTLCLKGGNSPLAAVTYSFYGLLLCAGIKDIELGYQFGQLALKTLEQFQAKAVAAKVHNLFYGFIKHWKEPASQSVSPLPESVQIGLETGDIEFACYIAMHYCSNSFLIGEPLDSVRQKQLSYINLIESLKQDFQLNYARIWGQLTLNLSGKATDKYRLVGTFVNEFDRLPVFQETNNYMSLFVTYLAKGLLNYFFKDYAQAVVHFALAEEYVHGAPALMAVSQAPFYYSLALSALYSLDDKAHNIDKRPAYLEKIAANQQQMKHLAEHAPMNYQHKYDLVEAEQARVLGQDLIAMGFYEKAIAGARENEYIHEEALAYELAAKFYLGRGMDKFAGFYMKESLYRYKLWGALAKVKDLEASYPQFLSPTPSNPVQTTFTTSMTRMASSATSATSPSNALDLKTVMKAAQILSGEIVLSRLLEKMMHIVIENAGAEKGFLLLPQQEHWFIEAENDVDSETINVLQSLPIDESKKVATSMIHYVVRTQEDVVLNNASVEGHFTQDAYILKHQPKSVLCTPLVNQGRLSGILYLENNLAEGAFTEERLQVLQVLSSQIAISIENALLYQTLEHKVQERTAQLAKRTEQLAEANEQLAHTNEQLAHTNEQLTTANAQISTLNERLTEENMRMTAELDVARHLQQMLLPRDEELKQIEGLDIAGFMEPTDEVGGDYYDVLQHNGRILCGIGDVTGHGLESGVLAIMVQSVVRALLTHNETDPVKFLNTLNRTIYDNVQRMESEKYLTFALLELREKTWYLSGQHEEMIVVQNGVVERFDTDELGFPIGLEPDILDFVAQIQLSLNPGDVVVLYTDGITEALNPDKVEYRLERLCEVISRNWQRSAEEILKAVIADVRQYIGTQKVYDDITLLVIKPK